MNTIELGTIIEGTLNPHDLARAFSHVLEDLNPRDPALNCYRQIVFMQGWQAEKPLKILNANGAEAATDYLSQWDYGDGGEYEQWDCVGNAYTAEFTDGYRLAWQMGLEYIGLDHVDAESIGDLVDAINEHCPDGVYFGAHPDDGADFGFWEVEQ